MVWCFQDRATNPQVSLSLSASGLLVCRHGTCVSQSIPPLLLTHHPLPHPAPLTCAVTCALRFGSLLTQRKGKR